MNFQPDTLIALAFLVPVAVYVVAGILAAAPRRLEPPFVAAGALPPEQPVAVDVSVPAANDDWMREAA